MHLDSSYINRKAVELLQPNWVRPLSDLLFEGMNL